MYRIKARGYGGGGPSIAPFETTSIDVARREIADLLDSDHAVQLYRVDGNGVETRIEFDYYTTTVVTIGDDMP
jgi:hypothetical protein